MPLLAPLPPKIACIGGKGTRKIDHENFELHACVNFFWSDKKDSGMSQLCILGERGAAHTKRWLSFLCSGSQEIYIWNIYGIYIYMYIYMEIYVENNQTHRRRLRRRPNGSVCLMDIYGYLWLYHKYLWIYQLYIPYIFHIYFLDMFHVFSLVCFLIYGVKRRQVLIAKPRFYFYFFQILHLLYFY